jgi:hypothetical protein
MKVDSNWIGKDKQKEPNDGSLLQRKLSLQKFDFRKNSLRNNKLQAALNLQKKDRDTRLDKRLQSEIAGILHSRKNKFSGKIMPNFNLGQEHILFKQTAQDIGIVKNGHNHFKLSQSQSEKKLHTHLSPLLV